MVVGLFLNDIALASGHNEGQYNVNEYSRTDSQNRPDGEKYSDECRVDSKTLSESAANAE